MKWPFNIFGKSETPVSRAITYDDLANKWGNAIGSPSKSGVVVNESTALGVSAFWCAVKVISEGIGKLPFVLYDDGQPGERRGRKGDIANHPVRDILQWPNPETTGRVFWESYMRNALIWGNGFAEISRDGSGTPTDLWLIHPSNCTPERDRDGALVYRVRVPAESGRPGIEVVISAADMLHVPGLSADGIVGHNLLQTARDSIGFSVAAERYGQAYFRNMGSVSIYLSHPAELSEAAKNNIRRMFQANHCSVDNAGSVAWLEEGLTAEHKSADNSAGQYDETRKFQISEISRLFGISPTKLFELGRATWGNLSSLNTDFWDSTCSPWAGKIEAEVSRKLLLPQERRRYRAEFDADTLLRGDITTRYAAYGRGISAGFLTKAEVRAWEGLPELPEQIDNNNTKEASNGPEKQD